MDEMTKNSSSKNAAGSNLTTVHWYLLQSVQLNHTLVLLFSTSSSPFPSIISVFARVLVGSVQDVTDKKEE